MVFLHWSTFMVRFQVEPLISDIVYRVCASNPHPFTKHLAGTWPTTDSIDSSKHKASTIQVFRRPTCSTRLNKWIKKNNLGKILSPSILTRPKFHDPRSWIVPVHSTIPDRKVLILAGLVGLPSLPWPGSERFFDFVYCTQKNGMKCTCPGCLSRPMHSPSWISWRTGMSDTCRWEKLNMESLKPLDPAFQRTSTCGCWFRIISGHSMWLLPACWCCGAGIICCCYCSSFTLRPTWCPTASWRERWGRGRLWYLMTFPSYNWDILG